MIETTETVNAVLPLIIIIGGVGVAAVAGLALTWFGEKLKDKKLGIIGIEGSGKTTLAEYLANNYLPKKTATTIYRNDYKKRKLGDLGMQVAITDSRSQHTRYEYGQEREIVKNYDIILYLFDMSKLLTEKDKYFKKIDKEIRMYSEEFKNLQSTIDSEKILPDFVTKGLLGWLLNEVSEPREKIFIALGNFDDKSNELLKELGQDKFNLQLANIRKDFVKLFENFSDTISWQILFYNSLVDKVRANKTVNNIFEVLKRYFENKDLLNDGFEAIGKLLEKE